MNLCTDARLSHATNEDVGMYFARDPITIPSLTCFHSFWQVIPTSLYIFNVFYSCIIESVDSICRDAPDAPLIPIQNEETQKSQKLRLHTKGGFVNLSNLCHQRIHPSMGSKSASQKRL